MPTSGPRRLAKPFSSVTSSPRNSTALADELGAQLVERGALVGGDHRQLDDLLAFGDVHAGPGRRAGAHRVDDLGGDVAGRRPARARRRWPACSPAVHLGGRAAILRSSVLSRARISTSSGARRCDEADVELGAVAADEVHLAGQPGQGRPGRAAPARRPRRPWSAAARPAPGRAATDSGSGTRRGRVVDERREGAVVVAGDEQLRHAGEPPDRRPAAPGRSRCRVRALVAHASTALPQRRRGHRVR